MAAGDATITAVGTDAQKPSVKTKVLDLAVTANYATGGYAITAAQCGFTVLLGVVVIGNPTGYVFNWKSSTGKLLAYVSKDPANAGGADIVLQEVGNNVAISTPTVRVIAYGLLV